MTQRNQGNAAPYDPALSAVYKARRLSSKRRTICCNYALFADRKQVWITANPDATQPEYDRAMHKLAKECGV